MVGALSGCGRFGYEPFRALEADPGVNPTPGPAGAGGAGNAGGAGAARSAAEDAGCSSPCGNANCEAQSCGVSCELGRADCDRDPSNGCEVDTYASALTARPRPAWRP
jgi:hypothetical protein